METREHHFGNHVVDVYRRDDQRSLYPLDYLEARDVLRGAMLERYKRSRLVSCGKVFSQAVEIFVDYGAKKFTIWARRARSYL